LALRRSSPDHASARARRRQTDVVARDPKNWPLHVRAKECHNRAAV
jgi:hypothetical protein